MPAKVSFCRRSSSLCHVRGGLLATLSEGTIARNVISPFQYFRGCLLMGIDYSPCPDMTRLVFLLLYCLSVHGMLIYLLMSANS